MSCGLTPFSFQIQHSSISTTSIYMHASGAVCSQLIDLSDENGEDCTLEYKRVFLVKEEKSKGVKKVKKLKKNHGSKKSQQLQSQFSIGQKAGIMM